VKLPAHGAGLPGKEVVNFLLRPFYPPVRRDLRDAPPVIFIRGSSNTKTPFSHHYSQDPGKCS
jgi:hypothetical protein